MESEQREYRWRRLALASATIRILLAVAPAAAVVGFGLFVVRTSQRVGGRVDPLTWLLVTVIFTLGVLLGFEAIAGRLRTLGALLDISMEFPYQPPSRFSVAFTSPFHVELTTELDGIRRHLRRKRRGGEEADAVSDHLDRVESILTLAAITGTLEPGTRSHSHRVAVLADRIGIDMGLDRDRRRWLRWAALLHDVGKLTVPDEVLHKPASLSSDERRIVREHVSSGARIVRPLVPLLGAWAGAVGEHHERWDGEGYPLGLRGEGISLAGRIVAVADTYATMTEGRVYRGRVSSADGLKEIQDHAGGQFDPQVVAAFALSWHRSRSLWNVLRLPRSIAAALASVWASLGLPAASTAATLGLVGAVAAVAITAPAAVRASPAPPSSTSGNFEQAFIPPDEPALAPAPLTVTPSPSLLATIPPRPKPAAAPVPLPPPVAAVVAAPTIDLAPTTSAVEGVAVVIDATVNSAGSPAQVRVVFGDGTALQPVPLSNGSFQVAHVYVDEGQYALQVYATGDGGTSIATSNVGVTDYRTVISLPAQATASSDSLAVSGQLIDPSADKFTGTVDFGDGQGPQPLVLNGRNFTLSHTYATSGMYPVIVTVHDNNGVITSGRMTVNATAPPSP